MATGLEGQFYADIGSLIQLKKDRDEITGYVVEFIGNGSVVLSTESPFNQNISGLTLNQKRYYLKNFDKYIILSNRKW